MSSQKEGRRYTEEQTEGWCLAAWRWTAWGRAITRYLS